VSLFLKSWNAQLSQGHVVFKKYWAYGISKSLDDLMILYIMGFQNIGCVIMFCSMLFNHVTPHKVWGQVWNHALKDDSVNWYKDCQPNLYN